MFFLVTITVKVVQLLKPSMIIIISYTSSNGDFRKQTHESTKNTQKIVTVPIKIKEFPSEVYPFKQKKN